MPSSKKDRRESTLSFFGLMIKYYWLKQRAAAGVKPNYPHTIYRDITPAETLFKEFLDDLVSIAENARDTVCTFEAGYYSYYACPHCGDKIIHDYFMHGQCRGCDYKVDFERDTDSKPFKMFCGNCGSKHCEAGVPFGDKIVTPQLSFFLILTCWTDVKQK
jgi:hypothetical protein